jgi:predicted PurR-regulated permease PerM
MTEVNEVRIPWATLWKVLAAVALVWLWFRLWRVVMLLLVAIIIAIGLAPVVRWLERRRWSRGLAAGAVTLLVFGVVVAFLAVTWSSLSEQARELGGRLGELEQEFTRRAPQPLVDLVRQSGSKPDASMLAPYAARLGRAVVGAVTVFVLAFVLVFYFLLEGERAFGWVRHFVPARHRPRFDQTAREAHQAAFGYVAGNVVTSACAAAYVFIVLTALGVPAALLLALLAFLFDFIPVLGFVLSVAPAIVMAATVSTVLALAMVPIYLFYDFLENYFIAPRVYGAKLDLSKLAVLIAFVVGAELGGIVGAVLSLPVAAVLPTIDRVWLRQARISQGKPPGA